MIIALAAQIKRAETSLQYVEDAVLGCQSLVFGASASSSRHEGKMPSHRRVLRQPLYPAGESDRQLPRAACPKDPSGFIPLVNQIVS
jgi:hypothetical protein